MSGFDDADARVDEVFNDSRQYQEKGKQIAERAFDLLNDPFIKNKCKILNTNTSKYLTEEYYRESNGARSIIQDGKVLIESAKFEFGKCSEIELSNPDNPRENEVFTFYYCNDNHPVAVLYNKNRKSVGVLTNLTRDGETKDCQVTQSDEYYRINIHNDDTANFEVSKYAQGNVVQLDNHVQKCDKLYCYTPQYGILENAYFNVDLDNSFIGECFTTSPASGDYDYFKDVTTNDFEGFNLRHCPHSTEYRTYNNRPSYCSLGDDEVVYFNDTYLEGKYDNRTKTYFADVNEYGTNDFALKYVEDGSKFANVASDREWKL